MYPQLKLQKDLHVLHIQDNIHLFCALDSGNIDIQVKGVYTGKKL